MHAEQSAVLGPPLLQTDKFKEVRNGTEQALEVWILLNNLECNTGGQLEEDFEQDHDIGQNSDHLPSL